MPRRLWTVCRWRAALVAVLSLIAGFGVGAQSGAVGGTVVDARVTFAGASGRDVAAGLMKPEGAVAGVLGAQVLAHFRLRFDFPAGRLTVAPAR